MQCNDVTFCDLDIVKAITAIILVVKVVMYVQEADGGPKAALRVVSLGADLTNRGPTFDMDLAELLRDGVPIPYDEARQYFKRDPAHRHAPSACP